MARAETSMRLASAADALTFGRLLHAFNAEFGESTSAAAAVHPRIGTRWSAAEETPILEPPGFLMRNYGGRTVLGNVIAHVACGAIVGGFAVGLY
jgi:hypothetical protein